MNPEVQPHRIIAGHESAVHSLVFLPGTLRLVAGYRDGSIRIWNAENGKQEGTLMVHGKSPIASLAVTSHGTKIVSSDGKGSIKVWTVESHTLVQQWTRPYGYPSVAISPDDQFIAVGDGKLTLLPLNGGAEIKHSIKFRGSVASMCFSPARCNSKLACAVASGLYVFDVERRKHIFGPQSVDGCYPVDVLWSLEGEKVFSAWSDGAIRCFNPDTGETIGEVWRGRHTRIHSLSLSSDGSKLASAFKDRSIRFWDTTSGNPIGMCLQGVHGYLFRFTPFGDFLVSVGVDSKIYFWRVPWPSRIESQTDQAFFHRPSSLPAGQLSLRTLDDESEAPSSSDGADSSLYPPLASDQSTVMSEESQLSSLSAGFPQPLDLTSNLAKLSDRYSAGGGFGDVYRCLYHGGPVPIEVAVKAFRFGFTLAADADHGPHKMIRRELGIWKRLKHINIVPFLGIAYGFGMEGSMSLVSLWMPNDTLQNFLAKHDDNLAVVHRLQFLLDIANGLQYLHCFPIVHGDLSSNNVLLDANYTARLADFGYSCLVGNIPEALNYLQRSTTRPGALRWIAPEQALEDTFDRSPKTDIYSFGCVGLQVLSGKQPWSEVREDAAIVVRLVQGRKPARPQSRPVDDLHWELIEHCWSSVQDRPDAEAIISSVQRFLSLYPPFQRLRDIISDNPSLPSFGRAATDSSNANVGPLDRGDEDRIASLPNLSGPVRFHENDQYSESTPRPTTAESYAEPESTHKKRRL